MSSGKLTNEIRLELSQIGVINWRNQTGATPSADGKRFIRHGLCPGSSDLIGIDSRSGRFVAIEVKAGRDRLSPQQKAFLRAVDAAGGISGVARSVDDAVALIQSARMSSTDFPSALANDESA